MTSRGGAGPLCDRLRRDSDSSSNRARGSNPPSRHLWVGNLSHSLLEKDLTHHFLKFGELDSVAFHQGRSYAFINFKNDEEAIEAMRALQGFHLAGNPLRIEFTKADKSSSRNEDYLLRRDERSTLRGSPYLQRDSRSNVSPDSYYSEKSKMSDRSAEPSEVLWIGFPALLKVDEMILRKAFSPFGEIEKITVFPGRSYAFVRFRSVLSASRAKDTLQGKLFGNPRVHICFAKNEAGSSTSGRTPLSPHLKSNGRSGTTENFRRDRNFGSLDQDPNTRSPHFTSDLGPLDSDVYSFKRKGNFYPGDDSEFDWRFAEELGPPPDAYEDRGSPIRERGGPFHQLHEKFTHKESFFEEPWDLPEDSSLFHGTKKLKTGSFAPDRDLPEYPFTDLEQEKRAPSRVFSNFSQHEVFDKTFEAGSVGYKPVQDRPSNLQHPHGERTGNWRASRDIFPPGSGPLPPNAIERKRLTPEPEHSPLKLWKWEGTIAKGGTPVCHARCFPVGKAMDIMLPEFLDCTARTGLDMLAKHYYQAASAWVVFFGPASDADIGYYNEFMHYLGERQRAAVAKLDDRTTLFLVPPSDFSEKVLKVPGDMSISGVVLRLDQPSSNFGPPHHPNERRNTNSFPFHGDASYPRPSSPAVHLRQMISFPDSTRSGGDASFLGNVPSFPNSDPYNEDRPDYPFQQRNNVMGPNWSPHGPPNISSHRDVPSQTPSTVDSVGQDHRSVMHRSRQESSSAPYAGGMSSNPLSGNMKLHLAETKTSVPLSMPITSLQPQHLVQLASSLLGQQKQQSGGNLNIPIGEDFRQATTTNPSHNQYRTVQMHGLQNNQVGSEIPTSQLGQLQQLQQESNMSISAPPAVKRELQNAAQGIAQMQTSSTLEADDADPQKRLQATLQLAAALLQQIQQGKGS